MLERRADEVKDWEPILRDVQLTLDKALQQICHVRLMVESDGRTKKVSRRGFALFESPSKKDAAYAALYAFCAFLKWVHSTDGMPTDDEYAACG